MRKATFVGFVLAAAALLGGARAATAHPTGYPHRHVRGYGYAPQEDEYMTRVYLGFGGQFAGIIGDSGKFGVVKSGGGGSVWLGFRFTPLLALEFGYQGTYHNPADYFDYYGYYVGTDYLVWSLVSADLKFHLPTHSNLDPYLQAGAGYSWLGREGYGTDWSGPAFELGPGLDVWLGHFLTIGVRGLYRGAYLSGPLRSQSSDFLSALVFQANLAIHF